MWRLAQVDQYGTQVGPSWSTWDTVGTKLVHVGPKLIPNNLVHARLVGFSSSSSDSLLLLLLPLLLHPVAISNPNFALH